MPFIPDALRLPWNRVAAKAAPSTNMLFPKSDNSWWTRDSAGVDTLVGGPALGAPVAFTPTWTSTGTQPTIGNGVLTGRYIKIGKQVTFHFEWRAGTTTTFGTGVYRWTFPVSAFAHPGPTALGGWVYGEDAAVLGYQFMPRFVSTTTFELVGHSVSTTAAVGIQAAATVPFTWANADFVRGYIIYEAA